MTEKELGKALLHHAALRQGPVPPEAVAAGLVASADRRIGRPVEARLGLGDLLGKPLEVAGRQLAAARLLGRLGGAGQQPLVLAELEGPLQGLP